MIPTEILKKIRHIEIRTSRFVNSTFSGEYQSVFKGRGMEFNEVREYQPGDDIRFIDWNVTARMGKPFVKRFVEERELTVMFVVDRSASGEFGSQDKFKGEIAAEICALLAFAAIKNNDKVGLIIFTDQIELFIPPQKGRRHVLRVVREILAFKPGHRGTDIAEALDYLNRILRKTAIVFLISDFLDEGFGKSLLLTSKRHDLIAVTIIDPKERELPRRGLLKLKDAETGAEMVVDLSDYQFQRLFKEKRDEFEEKRRRMLISLNIDSIDIYTDRSYVDPLTKFFRTRERRLSRLG
jgi:uncharacterized protein (DUF58 family)